MKQWKGIEAQHGRGRRGRFFIHNRDSLLANVILEQTWVKQGCEPSSHQDEEHSRTREEEVQSPWNRGILNVFWGAMRRLIRAK